MSSNTVVLTSCPAVVRIHRVDGVDDGESFDSVTSAAQRVASMHRTNLWVRVRYVELVINGDVVEMIGNSANV